MGENNQPLVLVGAEEISNLVLEKYLNTLVEILYLQQTLEIDSINLYLNHDIMCTMYLTNSLYEYLTV